MAFLVTTIIIEVADDLVKNLPSARENLQYYTETAIRNRLFGQGFMPDDVEIDSWAVSSKWMDGNPATPEADTMFARPVRTLTLSTLEAETLKQIGNDLFEDIPGTGDYTEDEDEAIWSIIRKIKEL